LCPAYSAAAGPPAADLPRRQSLSCTTKRCLHMGMCLHMLMLKPHSTHILQTRTHNHQYNHAGSYYGIAIDFFLAVRRPCSERRLFHLNMHVHMPPLLPPPLPPPPKIQVPLPWRLRRFFLWTAAPGCSSATNAACPPSRSHTTGAGESSPCQGNLVLVKRLVGVLVAVRGLKKGIGAGNETNIC
jgi:hypothetical protein